MTASQIRKRQNAEAKLKLWRDVFDRATMREEFQLNEIIPLQVLRTPEDIVEQIHRMMHKGAMHEEDEWLRVDGKLPFDPHAGER